MFEYNICNQADVDVFNQQCGAIEKVVKGLTKQDVLLDVDGSLIQVYEINNQQIKVYNSYYVNAVYVVSDFDLEPYFN